ncbi:hypothetical protein GN956_G5728 [Arapaima gigas]
MSALSLSFAVVTCLLLHLHHRSQSEFTCCPPASSQLSPKQRLKALLNGMMPSEWRGETGQTPQEMRVHKCFP